VPTIIMMVGFFLLINFEPLITSWDYNYKIYNLIFAYTIPLCAVILIGLFKKNLIKIKLLDIVFSAFCFYPMLNSQLVNIAILNENSIIWYFAWVMYCLARLSLNTAKSHQIFSFLLVIFAIWQICLGIAQVLSKEIAYSQLIKNYNGDFTNSNLLNSFTAIVMPILLYLILNAKAHRIKWLLKSILIFFWFNSFNQLF
jgi:hypothetical protein